MAQKSAQGIERTEDRSKNVGTFEGSKVGTLNRKRLTVPTGSGSSIESWKLNVGKQEKRARESRSGSPMAGASFELVEPTMHG